MRIAVYGQNNKIDREDLRDAVYLYVQHLCGTKLANKLSISLINCAKLDCLANCCANERRPTNRPRRFQIRLLATQSRNSQLFHLAHECVHVKQYARGELSGWLDKHGNMRWKAKSYSINGPDLNKQYWFWPWEVEAYGMAHGLLRLYNDEGLH